MSYLLVAFCGRKERHCARDLAYELLKISEAEPRAREMITKRKKSKARTPCLPGAVAWRVVRIRPQTRWRTGCRSAFCSSCEASPLTFGSPGASLGFPPRKYRKMALKNVFVWLSKIGQRIRRDRYYFIILSRLLLHADHRAREFWQTLKINHGIDSLFLQLPEGISRASR